MLWLQWVTASVCGGLLTGTVMVWMWWIGALLLGTLFSIPQWLVLRSLIPHASRWVFATTGGVLISWVAGIAFGYPAGVTLAGMTVGLGPSDVVIIFVVAFGVGMGGAAAGAVVGLAQRPLLREQFQTVDLWVPVSSLSGALLALAAVAPLSMTGLNTSWVWLISGVLGGLAYGIITATTLVRNAWLTVQPDNQPLLADDAK